MSRLHNGLILAAMLTLMVSGCGEAMPVAMFVAENPPARPGQKPVDDTGSIRPVPFTIVLDTAEADTSLVAESLCPICENPLKSGVGICFYDLGDGTGEKEICAREFSDLASKHDPQNSQQIPRCQDHNNDDPTAGLLCDGVVPSLVQNWCSPCKTQYESAFRGRCPHCSKPVSLLKNICLDEECSGRSFRSKGTNGPKSFGGFYAIVTGDTALVSENGTTLFCPQEGCGAEIAPEEGFCGNAETPHRYRVYPKSVPCSRCGGSKLCPECTGSGLSRTAEPIRPCWFCTKTKSSSKGPGVCPQCDEDGFETLGNSR